MALAQIVVLFIAFVMPAFAVTNFTTPSITWSTTAAKELTGPLMDSNGTTSTDFMSNSTATTALQANGTTTDNVEFEVVTVNYTLVQDTSLPTSTVSPSEATTGGTNISTTTEHSKGASGRIVEAPGILMATVLFVLTGSAKF